MTDRSQPNPTESLQQSIGSRETIAPSGLDSAPTGSGPFASLPVAFGRFEVRKLLGRGAMGTVYLAFDPEMNKQVALKIPKFQAADEPVLLERFWREAQATGAMNHPNICGMYEVGEIAGTHFISMEYIDGRPLADYIGPDQPQRQVAAIVRKLAQGLAHAHELGFIHRDLKPSNVMIAADGQPKIMDFGLALRFGVTGDIRLTQSNTIVGSPAYMSPEQARSENDTLTPASDIYSLGTLFFELLTGALPFQGPMAVVLGRIALQKVPQPSTVRQDVDPRLESLCLKMLEKKPAARPPSMTDVAVTLTEWLKGGGSSPEIALRDEASPTESVALTPVKPTTTPRAAKGDGIEAQKQRVTDLLDKHQYGPAIELLEKMTNLRDARFEKLVAWAKPKLKEVRVNEQNLREASAPSCDTAQQLLKHYDYTGAAELLAQVPPAYRSIELRDLLEKVTDLRDECDHLQRDIEEAVRTGDTETLPALVKRLFKLKPNNNAIKQLYADMKEYGAAKVIARRKGQRRFLDSNERVIETKHIVGSVVLVVGLFVGVSLLVRNYSTTSAPSEPMKSSEQVMKSEPIQPATPVVVVQSEPVAPLPEPTLTVELPQTRPAPLILPAPNEPTSLEEPDSTDGIDAMVRAINWLERHQNPDGSWGCGPKGFAKHCKDPSCTKYLKDPKEAPAEYPMAATAFGLLPYFAAGHTHETDGPYKGVINRGLTWMTKNQNQKTGQLGGGSMYEHGLATIALCEAYGLSKGPQLQRQAQAAIAFIVDAQNDKSGGWHYVANPPTAGDTSVVGWQMMALKSGEMAGLRVNPQTLIKAKRFLKTVAKGKSGGQFSYMADSNPTPTMSAVGLLCNQYGGMKRTDPAMVEGQAYVMSVLSPAEGNPYFFYYATRVMHNLPGPEWDTWNRDARRFLIKTQIREKGSCAEGSWNPEGKPHVMGPVMMTSIYSLSLDIHNKRAPSIR